MTAAATQARAIADAAEVGAEPTAVVMTVAAAMGAPRAASMAVWTAAA